jgi:uncharacterized membrane protein
MATNQPIVPAPPQVCNQMVTSDELKNYFLYTSVAIFVILLISVGVFYFLTHVFPNFRTLFIMYLDLVFLVLLIPLCVSMGLYAENKNMDSNAKIFSLVGLTLCSLIAFGIGYLQHTNSPLISNGEVAKTLGKRIIMLFGVSAILINIVILQKSYIETLGQGSNQKGYSCRECV